MENYSLLNTHVSFNFDLSLDKNVTVNYQLVRSQFYHPILSSIHHYTLAEFKNFILGLDDNNVSAYQILQIFREGSNIKKEVIPETVGEVKKNPERIKELYENLCKTMNPSAKVTTPFSFRKKEREEALVDRIEQLDIQYPKSNIGCGNPITFLQMYNFRFW